MSDSKEVITDPRFEKRTRRQFSVAERKRLLAEADALPYGEKGARRWPSVAKRALPLADRGAGLLIPVTRRLSG